MKIDSNKLSLILNNCIGKTIFIEFNKNDTRGIRTLADKSNSLAGYHLNHSAIVSIRHIFQPVI